MPKYCFEQSVILPEGESLNVIEAHALASVLAAEVRRWMVLMHHERHEVSHDEPFEQVTGDWLPADDNGVTKMGPSRPIDL